MIISYLLFPGFQFLHQEVVALGNLGELIVHTALKFDEVLPRFLGVARVLVTLAHNLVEVAHGHLGRQGLLLRAAEDSLQASVLALRTF